MSSSNRDSKVRSDRIQQERVSGLYPMSEPEVDEIYRAAAENPIITSLEAMRLIGTVRKLREWLDERPHPSELAELLQKEYELGYSQGYEDGVRDGSEETNDASYREGYQDGLRKVNEPN